MFRFTIRDMLWLTVVVACLAGWAAHHAQKNYPLKNATILLALKELQPQGITRLDDATTVHTSWDGKVSRSGKGIGSDGALHAVFVAWLVADFGKETRWQLEATLIDGATVPAPPKNTPQSTIERVGQSLDCGEEPGDEAAGDACGQCDQIGMLISHFHDNSFLHAHTIGGLGKE